MGLPGLPQLRVRTTRCTCKHSKKKGGPIYVVKDAQYCRCHEIHVLGTAHRLGNCMVQRACERRVKYTKSAVDPVRLYSRV